MNGKQIETFVINTANDIVNKQLTQLFAFPENNIPYEEYELEYVQLHKNRLFKNFLIEQNSTSINLQKILRLYY